MVSIVIPAYREPYLNKTIESLLKNGGDIEVIPVIDGYKADPLPKDPRVKPVYLPNNVGMRGAENAGIEKAKGEFLMKVDAHCVFAKDFDTVMSQNCQENWLLIPRRFSLKEDTWTANGKRVIRDYHYIAFPQESDYGFSMYTAGWRDRARQRRKIEIDDTMSFQGSCWFANRKYFMEHVGYLDDSKDAYTGFAHEQIEVGLKYWLGGGENKVIKKTWYGHLSKRKHHYDLRMFSRRYKKNRNTYRSHTWATKHWMNNEEPNMIHKFEWLVDKFWPIPTWSEDWKERWEAYGL